MDDYARLPNSDKRAPSADESARINFLLFHCPLPRRGSGTGSVDGALADGVGVGV